MLNRSLKEIFSFAENVFFDGPYLLFSEKRTLKQYQTKAAELHNFLAEALKVYSRHEYGNDHLICPSINEKIFDDFIKSYRQYVAATYKVCSKNPEAPTHLLIFCKSASVLLRFIIRNIKHERLAAELYEFEDQFTFIFHMESGAVSDQLDEAYEFDPDVRAANAAAKAV